MSRQIPVRFKPELFKGPRVRLCQSRQDLFQQLAGDLFRAMAGDRVIVGKTLGNDGGIDVFVPSGNLLLDMHSPVIIECKDHDDSRDKLRDRIFSEWNEFEGKIKKQAGLGWEGLYRPWLEAKSFIYCVSCVIPSPDARIELEERVAALFKSIDVSCGIRSTRVLDWGNIRDYLTSQALVQDRWVGLGIPRLVPHEEFVRSLTSFRSYLVPSALPFLSPGMDKEWHPANIFSKIEREDRGVLISGPGGVGKTRSMLEVAERAYGCGWRVLHLTPGPGDRPLDVDEFGEVVFCDTVPTLITIDYLEQAGQDFESIRSHILLTARLRNQKVAVLATARPAYPLLNSLVVESNFNLVEINLSDEMKCNISLHVQNSVAPRALELLGEARVGELCGSRPAIALFISLQLEERVTRSSMDIDVHGLNQGDLLVWLKKRLAADGLVLPAPPSVLEPAVPGGALVGAATALAVSPQEEDAISSAVSNILGKDALVQAKYIVAMLKKFGWLEERGEELAVAHDVVVDELLGRILKINTVNLLRTDELRQVLSPALRAPLNWQRLAVSLGRLYDQERDTHFGEQLIREVENWVMDMGLDLAFCLRAGQPLQGADALSALATNPLWGGIILNFWDSLAIPWLDAYKRLPESYFLLRLGLDKLAAGRASKTIDAALDWLALYSSRKEASFVLSSIVQRSDLVGLPKKMALRAANQWLKRYGRMPIAGYVLYHLLHKGGLKGGHRIRVVEFGVEWVRANKLHPAASFIFYSLLRARMDQGRSKEIFGLGVEWLELYFSTYDAQYVLDGLWANRMSSGGQAGVLNDLSLRWLRIYKDRPSARFVLEPLLCLFDLEEDDISFVRSSSLLWLKKHLLLESVHVLGPLFSRRDLSEDELADALLHARAWLDLFGLHEDANFVLTAALRRRDLGEESRAWMIDRGVIWLRKNQKSPRADFVINSLLLWGEELHEEYDFVVSAAIEWLRQAGSGVGANRLLFELWNSVQGTKFEEAVVSLGESLGVSLRTSFVIGDAKAILRRLSDVDLDPFRQKRHIINAVEWFCQAGSGSGVWARIFARLITLESLPDELRDRILKKAYDWALNSGEVRAPYWSYVFGDLLRSGNLPTDLREALVGYGVKWLGEPEIFQSKGWRHTFSLLVEEGRGLGVLKGDLFKAGYSWLTSEGEEQDDHWNEVFECLIGCEWISDYERTSLAALRTI